MKLPERLRTSAAIAAFILPAVLADPGRAQPAPPQAGDPGDAPAAAGLNAPEVVVVANRAPEPLETIGQSVSVLDATAIRESQATQVADLLVQTPGITLVRNGGEGQTTSIFIRGADSDQTLVLIDGVQLNDPSEPSGGYDFSNLLIGDISRIEILRGAQSTLWGSQAIGGVVDIMTAAPTQAPSGELDVEGGSRSTQDYKAAVGDTLGPLSFRGAASYYTTGGIDAFDRAFGGRVPDPFHNFGASGRVDYALAPNVQLDLRGYYTNSYVRFDGYDTPTGAFGDDREYGDTTQYIGYAGVNFQLLDGRFRNKVDVQYTDTDRREYDPDLAAYGPTTETFYGYGENTRFEYQGNLALAPGYQAVFGAQHEFSSLRTDTPAYDAAPSPVSAHKTLDSGYLQLQGEVLKGLNLTGGVRYDDDEAFGGHATGQLSAAWDLNGGSTILRASFGQGFKAPALYQLYSPYGDPDLRPEISNSWDFGVEQHFWDGRATLSATYFGRDSRDLIEFVSNDLPPNFGVYQNVDHATAEGVELQASVKPFPRLTLSGNYTYTDAEDATNHTRLYNRPKDAANLDVAYVWPLKLSTTLAVRYSGDSLAENFNTFPSANVILKAYTLLDLRASYPVTPALDVYARVENLTNEHYETAYEYGSLGRGFFIGVRAKL